MAEGHEARVIVSLTLIRLVRQAKQPGEGLPVFTIVGAGRSSQQDGASEKVALSRILVGSAVLAWLVMTRSSRVGPWTPWMRNVDHDSPVVGSPGS